MASWDDVAWIVAELPDTAEVSPHNWRVRTKLMVWERPLRKADLAALGEDAPEGTVTLIEKCSGAVGFVEVATEHRWVVHISGGSVGRGDLTPDREAVGHLGSPFGRAEQMPSRPEVCEDAAEADRTVAHAATI